jgi:hypothetical protein
MQSAKDCLKRHYLQYEYKGVGLKPIRQSEPLRFGGNFHVGLDLLAKGMSAADVCDEIRARYAELPGWCQTDEDILEWQVECEKVMRLLLGYVWYWGYGQDEVVAAEQTFEIPLLNPQTGRPSTNWTLKGRIDSIVNIDGRMMLMEHKTTSDPIDDDSDYWRKLRIDSQISLYMLGATESGYPVRGVLYDVIAKPRTSLRNPLYQMLKADKDKLYNHGIYYGEQFDLHMVGDAIDAKKETVDMFGARLSASIAENPESFYVRKEIPRLESDIDELKRELWGIQKRLTFCKMNGYWDRNTSACQRPYKCECVEICYGGFDVSEDAPIPPGYMLKSSQHEELEEDRANTDENAQTAAATPTQAAAVECSQAKHP